MSAKNFSSALEGKDIQTRSQTTRSSTQSQATGMEADQSKGNGKKGKKAVLDNVNEGGEGSGEKEGEVGEGGNGVGDDGAAKTTNEGFNTGNGEVGEKDDGGIEVGNGSEDDIAGLGPDIESMKEAPHIEHGHEKWIRNIRGAFSRSLETHYRIFKEEYRLWCEKEDTEVRDIELMQHFYEAAPPKPVDTAIESPKETTKTKSDTNTTMELGTLPENDMTALSKYFDDIMKLKNVHMPVSIFDPVWILQDSFHMKTRSVKTSCSSNVITYIGIPYMNEYRLTHTQWSTRFDLMVKYQEEKYDILDSQKHSPIAPRLRTHKENVLQLMRKYYGKWPPAMRYDIAHRRNCWENRLPNGAMADVGTMNKDLAEQAKDDSQHFGDYKYIDNPYAFGMAMQNISPINGETYPAHASWDATSNLIDTHADMLTGRNVSNVTNQPVTSAVVSSLNGVGASRNNRYLGRHFNPYYSCQNNHNFSTPYNNSSVYSNDVIGSGFGGGGSTGTFRGTGRGGGRGGRGSRGGRGGARPSIGPGSFDKSSVPAFVPNGGSGDRGTNTNPV